MALHGSWHCFGLEGACVNFRCRYTKTRGTELELNYLVLLQDTTYTSPPANPLSLDWGTEDDDLYKEPKQDSSFATGSPSPAPARRPLNICAVGVPAADPAPNPRRVARNLGFDVLPPPSEGASKNYLGAGGQG